jgi:hypothetical protein
MPEARLLSDGRIVSMDGETELMEYSGLLYAVLAGNPYVLWRFPDAHYAVINAGSTIVQAELDRFVKEYS